MKRSKLTDTMLFQVSADEPNVVSGKSSVANKHHRFSWRAGGREVPDDCFWLRLDQMPEIMAWRSAQAPLKVLRNLFLCGLLT